MTPETHTLFSVTLFLALSSLLAWTGRKDRNARRMRATLTAALQTAGQLR